MQAMMTNSHNDKNEFRYKLDRLKESVDPRYLVESLGFNIMRETAKELRGPCIIHGGDNKTAFRFNKETRTWICFSHRCHEIFGADIIGLIKAALDVDFVGAMKYLENLVGDIDSSRYVEYKRKKERELFIRSKKTNQPRSSIVTEECLKQFKPFRSKYFVKQGFTTEILDYFEIAGGYTDGGGLIRDIIPIRDDEDMLVAYSFRDIRNFTDYDNKYIHTLGFNKDKVLYNLNNAKNFMKNGNLIVVEGFKSVWKLCQYDIQNVVAVMGTQITFGQENLLYKYPIDNLIIFFDGDTAGISGAIKICERLRGKLNVIPIFITEEGKDPADLSKEIISGYLKGYI